MRDGVHDNSLHRLKMILAARDATFTLLLMSLILAGSFPRADAASATSHDRSDLQELLEKLETSLASSSSRSAAADTDSGSAAPSGTALSSFGGSDASDSGGGAPLPIEVSRRSQSLESHKSPLAARLEQIEQLLRQQQHYEPTITEVPVEVKQVRGFDRHGRLFGEQPSAPASRQLDLALPAGRDQFEESTAVDISQRGNEDARAVEQGGRILSLLAKLLQQQQQQKSSSHDQLQVTPHPQSEVKLDAVPSGSESSDATPSQQVLQTLSLTSEQQQQQQQQHSNQREQLLSDAVMQLISVVRDLAEDEQRLRSENEEMLDTVVSIAALEERRRLADGRRTRLEAKEAGQAASDN